MPAVRSVQRNQNAGRPEQYRFAESDLHDSIYCEDSGAGAVCGKGAYAGSQRKDLCAVEIEQNFALILQKKLRSGMMAVFSGLWEKICAE